MITLAESNPYLLAESEERPTQQGDRESKKDTGSVFVLQPEESARKSHDKEQRRAHSADKCQVCCAIQKFGASPQARNIRLEARTESPSAISFRLRMRSITFVIRPSRIETKPATAPRMKAGAVACTITCES